MDIGELGNSLNNSFAVVGCTISMQCLYDIQPVFVILGLWWQVSLHAERNGGLGR
jgi:hypothetical protein